MLCTLDRDSLTPLFAMPRITEWRAHVIEQMQNNTLIRPDLNDAGPVGLPWTPVDQRGYHARRREQ